MAGKPTIPEATLARIRKMRGLNYTRRQIMDEIGCSLYTVRKALQGDEYIKRERARWREADAARAARRAADPAYRDYQAAYGATDERRARVRANMAALRERRKADDG